MAELKSNNSRQIALVLWLMLTLNLVFIWTKFFPNIGEDFITWLDNGLESIRVPLTIVEFIAIGTLFVDLVMRYDSVSKKLRTLHVIGVGICVCGFIFKAFIFFLHSAYLS
tara:strand:+ start:104 stop:436 length:333 start_codon:yes stop_codon:yes gene_type:complete